MKLLSPVHMYSLCKHEWPALTHPIYPPRHLKPGFCFLVESTTESTRWTRINHQQLHQTRGGRNRLLSQSMHSETSMRSETRISVSEAGRTAYVNRHPRSLLWHWSAFRVRMLPVSRLQTPRGCSSKCKKIILALAPARRCSGLR